MDRGRTGIVQGGTECPACERVNSRWANHCAACRTQLREPQPRREWTGAQPRLASRPPATPAENGPEAIPWALLGIGALAAPVFAFVPLLQYMGWFLASLVHELGHVLAAWFFGQPAYPAIRLDGHAAAFHSHQKIILVVAVGIGLAALTYALRHHRRLRVVSGTLLALYPLLALTQAREVVHLLGGHLSEMAFAAVFFYRAVSGGFTASTAERVTYATMAWFLLGRNVVLNAGLVFSESARATYFGNGSFGLTNDFIRAARHLGWSLEVVGGLMLLISFCVLPAAWWFWRTLDQSHSAPEPAA